MPGIVKDGLVYTEEARCRRCRHREPKPGSKTCEICSTDEAERMRQKRIDAREAGLCQFCFRQKVDLPGHYYCKFCIKAHNERTERYKLRVAELDRQRKERLERKRQETIKRLSGATE